MKHKDLEVYVGLTEGGCEDVGHLNLYNYTLLKDERLFDLEAAEKEVESLRQGIALRDDVVATLAVERDALRAKVERMTKRLRLIVEEPENTMSNSKAMREMLRQAHLALEESK